MGCLISKNNTEISPYSRFVGTMNISEREKINQEGKNPLCYFERNCNRKNLMHHNEFSHNEFNYNGVRASKAESCNQYLDTHVSQSHLGGGSAGMVQQPKSQFDDRYVRNAGLALITHDKFIVLVVDSSSKLNFPSGKREIHEKSLDCAIRETDEELGIQRNPQVLKVFHSGLHTNLWKFVKTHRNLSQTAIYVYRHTESSKWFIENFRRNSECSAIVVMSIQDFIRDVEQRPDYFRFPESMTQFVAQFKHMRI